MQIANGCVFFCVEDSKMNHHGKNMETIRGWKVTRVNIAKAYPGRHRYYMRWILYRPSGAWWFLDICIRRNASTEGA